MSLPWFRLYRELKDDPKIGLLDDATFRVFIESMCWACERSNGGGIGLTMENVAWAFRRDVSVQLKSLFKCGVMKVSGSGEIVVTKWSERQMSSDVSTERVRKFRQNNKGNVSETFQKRPMKRFETVQEERRGEEKYKTNRGFALKESGVQLLSLIETCKEILGEEEMTKYHKRWTDRAMSDPVRLEKVLSDMKDFKLQNGVIKKSAGARAEQLWGQLK